MVSSPAAALAEEAEGASSPEAQATVENDGDAASADAGEEDAAGAVADINDAESVATDSADSITVGVELDGADGADEELAAPVGSGVVTETKGTDAAGAQDVGGAPEAPTALQTQGDADATTVTYTIANGTTATSDEYYKVTADATEWTAGLWVVDGTVAISDRVTVSGEVTLVLLDGCELTAGRGITVAAGDSLPITSGSASGDVRGTGKLVANASRVDSAAGIGGSNELCDCGEVTVNGGTVEATGGPLAAGIGGGWGGDGGTVTVSGGEVAATGGACAADIGGGWGGDGDAVTINGGTVTATGGPEESYYDFPGGPAIGAGYNGISDGTLSVSGGTTHLYLAAGEGAEALGTAGGTDTSTPDTGYAAYVQDASGADISADGANTPSGSAVDLGTLLSGRSYAHAFFAGNAYTVRFGTNGGSGLMDDQPFTHDEPQALSANAFERTGYGFAGWSADPSVTEPEYTDGEVVTNLATGEKGDESVTLYAVWVANGYAVAFDANGGIGTMANQALTYDSSEALAPPAFSREGYEFLGWSTNPTATEPEYADGATVLNLASEDGATVTLYAVWRELEVPAPAEEQSAEATAETPTTKPAPRQAKAPARAAAPVPTAAASTAHDTPLPATGDAAAAPLATLATAAAALLGTAAFVRRHRQ